jgi:DNA-binding MarR family transcriptional regulator
MRTLARRVTLAYVHAIGTTDAAALAEALAAFYAHAMRPTSRLIGEFERLDLSFTQFKALSVAAGGEPTVKELAERLGLSLPGCSRAVDHLVRRGLLDRREDPEDRRCKRLTVTGAGSELVHRLDDARRAALESFAEGLAHAHRERLLAALTPILEDLETTP